MTAKLPPGDEAPAFDVRFDAAMGILHLRLAGFWTMATVAGFTARLLATVATIRIRRRSFDVLSDATGFPIQSAAVTAAFTRIMERGARMNDGRTAIVVGSVMNKLQAERAMANPGLRVFLTSDEARAWLRSHEKDGQ